MQGQLDPSSTKKRGVVAVFKNSINTVSLADDEFHTVVDSSFVKKRRGGKPGEFAKCVRVAVQKVFEELRGTPDYVPIFLTDEAMGLPAFAAVCKDNFMSPTNMARYREYFRAELNYNIARMKMHVFGKLNSGSNPDI